MEENSGKANVLKKTEKLLRIYIYIYIYLYISADKSLHLLDTQGWPKDETYLGNGNMRTSISKTDPHCID